MRSTLYSVFATVVVAVGLMNLACESAPPGQFTADVTIGDVGKVVTGRIFVRDGDYRLEINDGGREWFLIVDQQAGVSRQFSPEHKTFLQVRTRDQQSVMIDQIQGMLLLEDIYGVSSTGAEEVVGYECTRQLVRMADQPLLTEYRAVELDFPIKIVNHISEEVFFELSNIRREAVADSLFAIPAGYGPKTEAGKGPVQLPRWIGEVEMSDHTAAPFEMTVASGQLFRIAVEAGYGLDVRGRNVGEGSASYAAVPFLNGLPINDVSIYSLNLPSTGTGGGWTFEETPMEADEIVVHVNQGTVAFTVEQVELGLGQTVSAGGSHAAAIKPGREVIVRLVNMQDSESSCVVSLSKDGTRLEGDTVGPVSFRSVTLRTKYASERRTYNVDADEITVQVESGQLLVNIRQP